MYFRLLLFFTMYNILLELQSQAVEVYLTADIFFESIHYKYVRYNPVLL